MFEGLFPTTLINDHAVTDFLCIGFELSEPKRNRRTCEVAVGGVVSSINQITCLLKFHREEESGGRIRAFGGATILIAAARFDVVDPEAETRFVGLAPEKIYILLTDKVLRCVEWIQGVVACRGAKRSVRVQSKLAETSLGRTERKVGARRRHRVKAVRLDTVEAIVAFAVGYGQTIFGSAQANRGPFNWIAATVNNPPGNIAIGGRRRGVRSQGPIREGRDICLTHPIVHRIVI